MLFSLKAGTKRSFSFKLSVGKSKLQLPNSISGRLSLDQPLIDATGASPIPSWGAGIKSYDDISGVQIRQLKDEGQQCKESGVSHCLGQEWHKGQGMDALLNLGKKQAARRFCCCKAPTLYFMLSVSFPKVSLCHDNCVFIWKLFLT